MAFYGSTEELDEIMILLWEKIRNDQDMSLKLLASKLIVRFNYREPDGHMTVDCSDGKEMKLSVGETDTKPIVEMFMRADVAHEFWLGRVNVPVAILSGKIVSKGPTNRALALLPVIKPAFAMYMPIYDATKAKFSSKA